MFIPGETIIHRFVIPFTTSDVRTVVVTYKQDGRIILEKTAYPEPSSGVSQVTIQLSQKESLLFRDDTFFLAQLNVIMTNGSRCTSREVKGINGPQHIRKVVT